MYCAFLLHPLWFSCMWMHVSKCVLHAWLACGCWELFKFNHHYTVDCMADKPFLLKNHTMSCHVQLKGIHSEKKKSCFHNEYSKHSICKWVWSAEGRRLIRSLLPAHVIYCAAAALLLTITDRSRFVHHHHHFHHKPQRVWVYWTLWWHWNCRRALTLSEWWDGSIASRKGMRSLYLQDRNSTRVMRLMTITTETICHWTGKSFTRARMNSLISIPTVRMGFSKVCTTATARACPIRVQLSAVQDGI